MAGEWYWWLVTWGTYGCWLPGDERGFRTWRKRVYVPPQKRVALAGEPTFDSESYARLRKESAARTSDAVHLSPDHQQIALDAIVTDIAELPIEPKIMAVTAEHLHLLAVFGELQIRPTVGRLKSRATAALKESPDWTVSKRTWAKGCHMESLEADDDQLAGYEYVRRHESQGLVQSWLHPKPTAPPS